MRNIIRLFLFTFAIFLYSCATQKQSSFSSIMAPLPIVQMDYYVRDTSDNVQPETFFPPQLYPGLRKKFFNTSRIEVKSNIDSVQIGIKLLTSKTANSESDYEDFVKDGIYQDLFDGKKYTIRSEDLSGSYEKKLPNNKFLKIIVYKKKDETTLMTGFFRIQRPVSFFNGFSSPVLFRVTGNAAGFNLNSISPSLGFNFIKVNINKEKFENISLDFLATITSYPQNLSDSYQYTMALGGIIDFGGYIQFGPSYSFIEKKTYLVIGLKPYLFSKLFGNNKE